MNPLKKIKQLIEKHKAPGTEGKEVAQKSLEMVLTMIRKERQEEQMRKICIIGELNGILKTLQKYNRILIKSKGKRLKKKAEQRMDVLIDKAAIILSELR